MNGPKNIFVGERKILCNTKYPQESAASQEVI
jgi:hypothetical protein